MKKILVGGLIGLMVLAAGCLARRTRFRDNFRNCSTAADGAIVCGGKAAAQVECFQPRSDSCRALALRYADGERVWLYEPRGFDPDNPQASSEEDEPVVLQPEMTRDASLIWFRRSNSARGVYETYEPLTGVFDEMDAMRLMMLRQRAYEPPISLLPQR